MHQQLSALSKTTKLQKGNDEPGDRQKNSDATLPVHFFKHGQSDLSVSGGVAVQSSTRLALQSSGRKVEGIKVNESVLSKIRMNRSSQRSNDDLQQVVLPNESISSSKFDKLKADMNKNTRELHNSGGSHPRMTSDHSSRIDIDQLPLVHTQFGMSLIGAGATPQPEIKYKMSGGSILSPGGAFTGHSRMIDVKNPNKTFSPVLGGGNHTHAQTPFGKHQLMNIREMQTNTEMNQPLVFLKKNSGDVDVSTKIYPARDTNIFHAPEGDEKKRHLNMDRHGNPLDVKGVFGTDLLNSGDFSDQIDVLNKMVFGDKTPTLGSQGAAFLRTPTHGSTPFDASKSAIKSHTHTKPIHHVDDRDGNYTTTPKTRKSFKSIEEGDSSVLHEMRSTFTTKGLGLMKPQALLNEPSEDTRDSRLPQITGPSQEMRSFEEQLSSYTIPGRQQRIKRGFSLANKTYQTLVVLDRPMQVIKDGLEGGLNLDQEFTIKRDNANKIFQQCPDDFRQTRSKLNYLKRTILSHSETSQLRWQPGGPYSTMNRGGGASLSRAIDNSKLDMIQKRNQDNLERFRSPKEILSRHPKYLREYRNICRQNKMNETIQASENNMPCLAQYQAFTPTGSKLSTRGDTGMDAKRESQNPFFKQATLLPLNADDRPLDTSARTSTLRQMEQAFTKQRQLQGGSDQSVQYLVETGNQTERTSPKMTNTLGGDALNSHVISKTLTIDVSRVSNAMLASSALCEKYMMDETQKQRVQGQSTKIVAMKPSKAHVGRNQLSTKTTLQGNVSSKIFEFNDVKDVLNKTIKKYRAPAVAPSTTTAQQSKMLTETSPKPQRNTARKAVKRTEKSEEVRTMPNFDNKQQDDPAVANNLARQGEFLDNLAAAHEFGYTRRQFHKTKKSIAKVSPEVMAALTQSASNESVTASERGPQRFGRVPVELLGRRAGFEPEHMVDLSTIKEGQAPVVTVKREYQPINKKKMKIVEQFNSIAPELRASRKDSKSPRRVGFNDEKLMEIRLSVPTASDHSESPEKLPGTNTVSTIRDGTMTGSTGMKFPHAFLSTNEFGEQSTHEREKRSKYLINMEPAEMIQMLGEQVEAQKGIDPFEALRSSAGRSGSGWGSGMTLRQQDQTSGLRTEGSQSESAAPNRAQTTQAFEVAPEPKTSTRLPPGYRRQSLVRAHNKEDFSKLPKLVSEVLDEEDVRKGNKKSIGRLMRDHISKQTCTCGVRDFLKELIRRLRGFDNKLPLYREELKKRLQAGIKDLTQDSSGTPKKGKKKNQADKIDIHPCVHDFEASIKAEKRIVLQRWFDNFQEQLMFEDDRKGRLKPRVFRQFIKMVLNDQFNPVIEGLEDYIVKNKLQRRMDLDYADFYAFNKYMGIMRKKMDKLKENQLEAIQYDTSSDSSEADEQDDLAHDFDTASVSLRGDGSPARSPNLSRASSPATALRKQGTMASIKIDLQECEPGENRQMQKLTLHQGDGPSGKNINRLLTEDDNVAYAYNKEEYLDILLNYKVTIGEKVYNNFISKLSDVDDFNVFKVQKVSDEQQQIMEGITKKKLEDALTASLQNVVKALKDIRLTKDERELLKQRHKYSSKKIQVRIVHPRVDEIDTVMEDKLNKRIEEAEDARKALRAKQRMRAQIANGLQKQLTQQSIKLSRSPSLKKVSDKSVAGSPVKQAPRKNEPKEIVLYEDRHQKQKFYQEAKRLTEHPADSYKARDAVAVKYFQECERMGILPEPLFVTLLKQQVLTIRAVYLSHEKTEALKTFLIEAAKRKVKEFQVRSLIIDDESMDDDKIASILEGLQHQQLLKSITLMNCTAGKRTVALLQQLLERKFPDEVAELHLINVKGLNQPIDSLLMQVIATLKAQNQAQCLQLSNQDLKSDEVINMLAEYISSSANLTKLDLSHSTMHLTQFQLLMESLVETQQMENVSLRGLNFFQLPSVAGEPTAETEARRATTDECIDAMVQFIQVSHTLRHLDLSGMAIGGAEMLRLARDGLSQSRSLLSVHLAQNHLGQMDIEELLEVMGIDYTEVITQIRKSLGTIEKEETLCPGRGGPTEEIKMLAYQQAQKKEPEPPEIMQKQRRAFDDLEQSDIVNILLSDVEKITSHKARGEKVVHNGGDARCLEKEFQGRLVLQRKLGYADSIFADKIQSQMFSNYKHFDLTNLEEPWQVRLRDEECYVCNHYVYHKIFYNRKDKVDHFERISDQFSVKALKFHMRAHGLLNDSDPYSQLPIMMGSIFDRDIPSARMINVRHQALLNWALKEIDDVRAKDSGKRDALIRKYIKAVQHVMQEDKRAQTDPLGPQAQLETQMMLQHFQNWRDYVLPGAFDEETREEYLRNEAVINLPVYQPSEQSATPDITAAQNQQNFGTFGAAGHKVQDDVAARKPTREDDEIFMFSGFIRPGNHNIIIYDPVTQSFWKRDNIIVVPRDPSVKLVRPGGGFRPLHVPEEVELTGTDLLVRKMKGPNFLVLQSHIFGDMLNDFSNKVIQICAENDIGPNVIDKARYLGIQDERSKVPNQLGQIVEDNYRLIVKLWRYLQQVELFDGGGAVAHAKTLTYLLRSKKAFKENIEQVLLDQLEITHDTMTFQFIGEHYPKTMKAFVPEEYDAELVQVIADIEQKAKESFNPAETKPVKDKLELQRRMLAIALMKTVLIINARSPAETLKEIFDVLKSVFEPPGAELQPTVNELTLSLYDNHWLRKTLLYQNKPLVTLLKINKHVLRHCLYENYLCTWQLEEQGLYRSRYNPPQYNPTRYFTTHESLPKFFDNIVSKLAKHYAAMMPGTSKKGSSVKGVAPTPKSSTLQLARATPLSVVSEQPAELSLDLLNAFAKESKMTMMLQEMQARKHSQTLDFHEFTLFLIHIACYLGSPNVRETYHQAVAGGANNQKPRVINLLAHVAQQTKNIKFILMDIAKCMQDLLNAISALLAAEAGLKPLKDDEEKVPRGPFPITQFDVAAFENKGYMPGNLGSVIGSNMSVSSPRSSAARTPRRKIPADAELTSDYSDGYDHAH